MMSCFQNLKQEDLQMKSVNGQWKLVGLVCLGEEHNNMQKIMTGKKMGLFENNTNDFFTLGVCLAGLASYSCNRHSTLIF